MECSVTGCDNPARKCGLCWAHLKRRRLGMPLVAPLPKREHGLAADEVLLREAVRLADAETEEEYDLRRRMLFRAARAYVLRDESQDKRLPREPHPAQLPLLAP